MQSTRSKSTPQGETKIKSFIEHRETREPWWRTLLLQCFIHISGSLIIEPFCLSWTRLSLFFSFWHSWIMKKRQDNLESDLFNSHFHSHSFPLIRTQFSLKFLKNKLSWKNKLRIKRQQQFLQWSQFLFGWKHNLSRLFHTYDFITYWSLLSEDWNCLCSKDLDLLNLQCLKD